MTNFEFKCWIKGYLELSDETQLSVRQLQILINHAKLVEAIDKNLEHELQKLVHVIVSKIEANTVMSKSDLLQLFTAK